MSKLSKFFHKKITGLQAFWVLIIACILYVEYYHYSVRTSDEISSTFQSKFEQQLLTAKKQAHQPTLTDLTSFIWQKACFIPPYMIEDDIQKLIGQQYKLGEIDTSDDGLYNLLFLLPDKPHWQYKYQEFFIS